MSKLSPSFVALCRVQAKSLAELAESVGSSKSIFLAALAGRRSFPDHRIPNLKREIGLDAEGHLDCTYVHRWKVRDVCDLNLVAETWLSAASLRLIEYTGQTEVVVPKLYLLQGVAKTSERAVYATVKGFDAALDDVTTGRWSLSNEPLPVIDLLLWEQKLIDAAFIRTRLSTFSSARKRGHSWPDVIEFAKLKGLSADDLWILMEKMDR
jgi:hypothetical protein